MPSLWLIPADASRDTVRVDTSGTLVGRDPSCTIQINDPSVSRRHATLEDDRGSWVVSDNKSANGTWIDGQRINKAFVRHGQSLRFGAVAFEVSTEDPAIRPRPPAPQPSPSPVGTVSRPKAPPPPAAPPAVAPPPAAAGGITAADAAELLGVRIGASRDEVRQHYQKIYNDFQIRLTNAPTAALKRMYQKNLQDLKLATELLAPGLLAELKA